MPFKQTERRLERLRQDYEAANARLDEVGFTREGSLIERYTTCNNANCRCADPAQRHGPYWQLSWKEGGKTISKLLSAEDAALYQEWISNRRRLEAALEQMRDLSRQAGEQIQIPPHRRLNSPTVRRLPTGASGPVLLKADRADGSIGSVCSCEATPCPVWRDIR